MAVVEAEAELLAAAGAGGRSRRPRPRRGARGAGAGRRGRRSRSPRSCSCSPAAAVAGVLLDGGDDDGDRSRADDGRRRAERAARGRADDGDARRRAACRAPPEGRVYQVWLKRAGRGRSRPTRSSARADGDAEVAVPGSLDGVDQVLVTDEPRAAARRPTTRAVISAAPA